MHLYIINCQSELNIQTEMSSLPTVLLVFVFVYGVCVCGCDRVVKQLLEKEKDIFFVDKQHIKKWGCQTNKFSRQIFYKHQHYHHQPISVTIKSKIPFKVKFHSLRKQMIVAFPNCNKRWNGNDYFKNHCNGKFTTITAATKCQRIFLLFNADRRNRKRI